MADAEQWPDISVEFGEGEQMPTLLVRGGLFPFPVRLRLGQGAGGRLVVSWMEIGMESADPSSEGQPTNITAKSLRQLAGALTGFMKSIAEHDREDDEVWRFVAGHVLPAVAQPYGGVVVRPGRRGHSDQFYREVAEAYRVACEEDAEQPFSLLARRLFRSESQTRRLVKHALEMEKPKDGGTR